MAFAENCYPFWMAMNPQSVTIRMIVWRDKVHIWVRGKKIKHPRELPWQVNIVILSKINDFAFLLLQQDVDLLSKGRVVAYSWQGKQHQVLDIKVFFEQECILFWTPV